MRILILLRTLNPRMYRPPSPDAVCSFLEVIKENGGLYQWAVAFFVWRTGVAFFVKVLENLDGGLLAESTMDRVKPIV
jgi:hypothetical protein